LNNFFLIIEDYNSLFESFYINKLKKGDKKMANTKVSFSQGLSSNLPTNNATPGTFYLTTDTGELYLGTDTKSLLKIKDTNTVVKNSPFV
jgi:hypothetical protein